MTTFLRRPNYNRRGIALEVTGPMVLLKGRIVLPLRFIVAIPIGCPCGALSVACDARWPLFPYIQSLYGKPHYIKLTVS